MSTSYYGIKSKKRKIFTEDDVLDIERVSSDELYLIKDRENVYKISNGYLFGYTYYKDIKSINDEYELYEYELKKIAQTGSNTYVSDDYKNYESIISECGELYSKEDFLKMIVEKPLNKLSEGCDYEEDGWWINFIHLR